MTNEKDIVPGLYDLLEKYFENELNSPEINDLLGKILLNDVNYELANEYAIKIGEALSRTFSNINSDVLPNGRLYYNIAKRTVEPMMGKGYELIADYCVKTQEVLNQEAMIKIKAIPPQLNQDRIDGIIDLVSGKEKYDDIAYMLEEPMVNFAQSIVDDSVKANADFQSKSGLQPKIIRTSSGSCCEWCSKLVGTYDYADVKGRNSDVFRRHKNCRCIVTYHPISGKTQNVHSKKILSEDELKELEFRRTINLEKKKEMSIEARKVIGLNAGGTTIKAISEHAIYRLENRDIEIEKVKNAVEFPLLIRDIKVRDDGNRSFEIIGEYATIYVNPDTGVITTLHKTHSKLAERLKRRGK